jgi:hypothetical protein
MSGPKGQSAERAGKSFMTVEWTNQHGCGDDDLNCNIVLQYMCQVDGQVESHEKLRNGTVDIPLLPRVLAIILTHFCGVFPNVFGRVSQTR